MKNNLIRSMMFAVNESAPVAKFKVVMLHNNSTEAVEEVFEDFKSVDDFLNKVNPDMFVYIYVYEGTNLVRKYENYEFEDGSIPPSPEYARSMDSDDLDEYIEWEEMYSSLSSREFKEHLDAMGLKKL